MKRSDILKVLEYYVDGFSAPSPIQRDHKVIANIILNKLEELGMRPYGYTKETTFDDLTLFKTVEGWEPED